MRVCSNCLALCLVTLGDYLSNSVLWAPATWSS